MADGDGPYVPFADDEFGAKYLFSDPSHSNEFLGGVLCSDAYSEWGAVNSGAHTDIRTPWRLDDLKIVPSEEPCLGSTSLEGIASCLKGEELSDNTWKLSTFYACNISSSSNTGNVEKKCAVRETRLRKQTKRYIEEMPDYNERRKKKPLKGACSHVPLASLIDKHSSLSGVFSDISDKEAASAESSCNSKIVIRRNNRLWTLYEVTKLVEGVARYGVGRWTEIKRLLFSSASHRTPVDLKDKWRNLLRLCCNKLGGKARGKHGFDVRLHQIPQSLLVKVRELAVNYPYPRGNKLVAPTILNKNL